MINKPIQKYRRIYRICPRGIIIPKGKKCLKENEVAELLDGDVVIEEKIDGGIVGLSWDHYNFKHLAIGKHNMVSNKDNSKKVYGLNKWIYKNYDKIQKIPQDWVIYGEWMKVRHRINYDKLLDYFMAFDVWNGQKYIDYENKKKTLVQLSFGMIPAIYTGKIVRLEEIIDMAAKKSEYSSFENMEGLVIKNYQKNLMGKFVAREFKEDKDWPYTLIIENKLRDR
jgi:hypothetical protein